MKSRFELVQPAHEATRALRVGSASGLRCSSAASSPTINRLLGQLPPRHLLHGRPHLAVLAGPNHTKIGADGTGVSQGQRQRILIARAVYKDPQFILFDEATNALDFVNAIEQTTQSVSTEQLYLTYQNTARAVALPGMGSWRVPLAARPLAAPWPNAARRSA